MRKIIEIYIYSVFLLLINVSAFGIFLPFLISIDDTFVVICGFVIISIIPPVDFFICRHIYLLIKKENNHEI